MLGTARVYPTIAVSDMNRATKFYEGVLGLEPDKDYQHIALYKTGSGNLEIYESKLAGTNKATAATWEVEDVAEEVEALKKKGVTFEHYDDMDGARRDGDLHHMANVTAAWFKDPDGNILCLHHEDPVKSA